MTSETKELPWSSLQAIYYNESAVEFKFTELNLYGDGGTTPGSENAPDNLALDQAGQAVVMKHEGKACGFLQYQIGETQKKLVVWIWMNPEESGADIKAGVFDEKDVFDQALLQKLLGDEGRPEDVGLQSEFVWKFQDEGDKRQLYFAVDIESAIIEEGGLADHWIFETPTVWIHIRDPVHYEKTLSAVASEEAAPDPVVHYDKSGSPISSDILYKIAASWSQRVGKPVHENLSICALIKAGVLPEKTTYDAVVGSKFSWSIGQPDTWEFVRGVIWNDDPACVLFNDKAGNNGNFALGVEWMFDFMTGSDAEPIIRRSHFGDLQFLHAMGCSPGEAPQETKKKIMRWLEIMYKLAAGGQGVSEGDRIDKWFGTYFNDGSKPKGSETLRALLMGKTPSYKKAIIGRRALGSCFHLVQDSYAVGHCKRHLLNRGDLVNVKETRSLLKKTTSPEALAFRKGHPGRFSAVENFHCYKGQDEKHHGHYDDVPSGGKLNATNLSSFECVVGGIDAIEKCTKLAQFWKDGTKWENGVQKFLDEDVFVLSESASGSDVNVDEHLRG